MTKRVMGLLKHFQNDVFISYARVDNIVARRDVTPWVTGFHEQLVARLHKRLGKPVSVWLDTKELDPAEEFNESINENLTEAGIMLCLVSQAFLESEYCRKEISWFATEAPKKATLSVNKLRRMVPIFLYDIHFDDWPKAFEGVSGQPFHVTEGNFTEPIDPDSDLFDHRIGTLAESIYKILTGLKELEDAGSTGPTGDDSVDESDAADEDNAEGDAFQVFFAAAPDELGKLGRQVVRGLANGTKPGYGIISGTPESYEHERHAEEVRAKLSHADLSVHLLGSDPGEEMDDAEGLFVPVEQLKMSLEIPTRTLILMPEHLNLETIEIDAYREFLAELVKRARTDGNFELVRSGKHEMLNAVVAARERVVGQRAEEERRRQEEEATAGRAGAAESVARVAFIDLHDDDVRFSPELIRYFGGRQIPTLMIPPGDPQPGAVTKEFKATLEKSQYYVAVFGDVSRDWVINRFFEAYKLKALNRLSTKLGVFVASPDEQGSQEPLPDIMELYYKDTLDKLVERRVKSRTSTTEART